MTQVSPMQRGKFITFEGIDGAGKSSHIESIVALLKAQQKAHHFGLLT